MDSPDFARLTYLIILLVAVGGWALLSNRQSLGKSMQQAAVWGLIFLGSIAAYGLWSDIRGQVLPNQSVFAGEVIEIPRGLDGHYALTLRVNGTPVEFLVDIGATQIVLSQRDAARIGIDTETLAYLGQAQTANGIVRTARVRLGEVEAGDIRDQNLRAVVNEGEINGSLLGMSYLSLFERVEISGNKMILTR